MDYRESHLAKGKGKSYHNTFSDYPYRKMVWEWEQKILKQIINDYFPTENKLNYLDFACGTGRILSFVEDIEKSITATGIDVSESMLDVAEQNTKGKLILGDLTKMMFFEENSFDLITSFRFFLNAQWELKNNAMKTLSYILKDNGILIFNIHMQSGSLYDLLLRFYLFFRRKPGHYNRMKYSEIYQLTKKFNLNIINSFHFGVIPVRKEENKNLPHKSLKYFEEKFSKIKLFRPLSRNLIIVCKKEVV